MTSEQKLNYYYENLPGIEWQDPEVTTDEIRELQKELEELQKLLEESYPKEELIKMIRDKNKEIAQMDTSIKLAKVNLEKVKKEVGSDTVYSELEGAVKAVRDPNSGDFTGSEAVVEVSGGGGFTITGAVSELLKDQLAIGQEVTINDWNSGMSYVGSITSVGDFPTSNNFYSGMGNTNVSYYPFAVFVDESADLREGDYVNMQFSTAGAQNGIYLQNPFLRTEKGRSYVLVMGEDGRLEQRFVTTGKSLWGSYTEILDGLTVDDRVAFPYGKNVKPGAKAVDGDISDLYQ